MYSKAPTGRHETPQAKKEEATARKKGYNKNNSNRLVENWHFAYSALNILFVAKNFSKTNFYTNCDNSGKETDLALFDQMLGLNTPTGSIDHPLRCIFTNRVIKVDVVD